MPPLNFVNSDLKQKADQLMDELWSGGVNIPTTSIEQISYLMFLKSLTEMDENHAELARKTGSKYTMLFSGSWANIVGAQFPVFLGMNFTTLLLKYLKSFKNFLIFRKWERFFFDKHI